MSAVLYDELGPRARRRVGIASVVAALVLAALVFVAVRRLVDRNQFDAPLWEPFSEWGLWRFLLLGLWTTVQAAAVAMVLATVIGLALALGRLSRTGPVRWLSGGYVEIFRAVPLLLFIYFAARGLPRYGIDLGAFWFLVVPLVVYNSAILGEIFRAGILSLDRGQAEAAYSLGMTYWQAMLLVVVPQAVRRMVPSLVSQLVTLLKDTSLGFVIPLEELLRRSQISGEFSGNVLQTVTVAALMYVIVNFSLSRLAVHLEQRQSRRYGGGGVVLGAGEDSALSGAGGAEGRPGAR